MAFEKAKSILLKDPETVEIVNEFAEADNRDSHNAARELIKRGFNMSFPAANPFRDGNTISGPAQEIKGEDND